MGDEDMIGNVKRWRDLVIEVVKEGGFLDRNLKVFIKEVC